MNLFPLAVWCGLLLSCTVSLSRRRQIKYPVTKSQNSFYERSHPTALDVLERTLLRPSDKGRGHLHPRPGRKRSAHNSEETTSPINSDLGDSNIDRCVASFGDLSPLCKPKKRQKKSFLGIPEIHHRIFRSEVGVKKNMTISTSIPVNDFFGVFKSSVYEPERNTLPTKNETFDSKFNISPIIAISQATQANSKLAPSSQSTTPQNKAIETAITQIDTFYQFTTIGEYVKTSSKNTSDLVSKNEANKIILPGSVQKIKSEPQLLYLDQVEIPQNDPKNELYTRQIEETEGNDATIDESMTSEGSLEEASTEATEPNSQLAIPQLKSSFLKGATYDKKSCESDKKKTCICLLSSVDSDFQTIFSMARLEDEIMAEVSNMECRRYSPAPSVFYLNTNAKPRVLKGKHAPFAIDNRHGAKEVTDESINEFIAYSALDDGITRVFVSTDVKIPCFPKPDIHLSATDADHVKYTWSFGNKKQSITQGRITEDDGDGSLIIQDVELTDSKNYTCEIDYIHPDTGERTTDTFVHSLEVVTLPTVSARAMVHYKSSASCDESLLEMFEMYLPQQVEQTICSPGNDRPQLCSVVIHSPVCHNEAQVTSQEKTKRAALEYPLYFNREKREGSMEMSMNYDVFIHRPGAKELPGAKAKLCNPDCHLLINFKLLQFFKESMQAVALIAIISKVQGGGTFTPVPSSVKVKYIFGCMGGYYLDNGFCLACPKGTYSDDGATECQKCPLHSYSGSVGTRKCTPCGHIWMPICNESFESLNIKMIFLVVGGVGLLLGSFIVYYVFWYKGQTWKEIIKKAPTEKIAKSERVKSRKQAKLEKQIIKEVAKKVGKGNKNKVTIDDEIKRLLVTSGESGTESEA